MRRQARLAIVTMALVGFGSMGLLLSSAALAQSNIQAGSPLNSAVTNPLSVSSGATSTAPRPLAPLALPAPLPAAAAAAPGAPGALSTTSALPALAPAPVVVAGGTVPVPQSTFTCSCFGVGLGTRWVGKVTATNFLSASSAAAAQCDSYAQNSGTQSPYIPPPGNVSLGRNPYPTVNANGAPGNVAAGFRGIPVFTETSAAQSGLPPRAAGCTRCACD